MATKCHKYELTQTFGVTTCETDFMHIYILRLIEKVLLWNDNADYLKESEITCLESVLLKTLNC